MKKIVISFILLFLICSFTVNTKRTLIEKFKSGNFSYNIYKEEKFLHEDNLNAEYFVVYRSNKKNAICGSFMSAKRNDTIFTKGSYSHTNNKLIFKEYYYHHQNTRVLDSMTKSFSPAKDGNLFLQEVIEFKNGKAKKIKLL